MKVKITDLMALYEDEHCSLSPTEEQHERAGDPSACMENTWEVNEVKQSKHRFGWKQGLSLAAALALVVLGGFGLKQLLNRGPAQLPQGQPGTTESTRPDETNDVIWWGWYPLDCAEQGTFSSFLSVFARQNIRQVPEDLSTDGALIRLAFAWRRNNEPESLTVQEGLPGLEIPHEGLTPEQVNETLKQLLGRSVAVPENGTEFDYSNQIGLPAGSTLFRSGWFWDEPTEPEPLRFALATYTLPDRSELLFTVYEWNTTDTASADPDTTFSLSTAQAEELADAGKLLRLQTGTAKLQQTERGWRLLSYQTEPAAEQHNVQATDLSEINWQLTYLAEQGIEKLETDLDEEYELAQFVHIYLKRHSDPGSDQLLYQSDETGSYETVGLGWVNLILDNMFGKTLSPIEGTDYTVLRGENYAQHESFHDGFFWWPAADGETSTRFARCNWARQEDGQVESSFMVYEADPAYMEQQRSQDITLDPGVDLEDWIWNQLIRMDDAELQTHIAAGEIIPIRTGTAKLQQTEQQGWRLLSYEAEPLPPSTEPDPDPNYVNSILSFLAEQGIRDLETELDEEAELVQFAHRYKRRFGQDAQVLTYLSDETGSYESLSLEEVNELLLWLFGKTVSPLDGTEYPEQQGRFRDGCFLWPAADGDIPTRFAVCTSSPLSRSEDPNGLVSYSGSFQVYDKSPDTLFEPMLETANDMSPEELDRLVAAHTLLRLETGSFRAELQKDGSLRLISFRIDPESIPQADHPATEAEDPALMAELKGLFETPTSWYSRALSSCYARPEDVNLYLFFYDGFSDEGLSPEELKALYGSSEEDAPSCPTDRLPVDKINEILNEYFGLSLEQTAKIGVERWGWLPETGCYYHCHGDTNMEQRQIQELRQLGDGTVLFTYADSFWNGLTDGNYPALHTAALRPDGAGNYLVISNLPGEWVTAKDLGALGALFRLSGPQRAETRDADGSVTVRELNFGMDEEFHYWEGDPDSEFSCWIWGKWWLADDHSLCCTLCETKEDGNRIGPWYTASFGCSFEGGELVLTQLSETGFHDDAPGTELRFAPVTE